MAKGCSEIEYKIIQPDSYIKSKENTPIGYDNNNNPQWN